MALGLETSFLSNGRVNEELAVATSSSKFPKLHITIFSTQGSCMAISHSWKVSAAVFITVLLWLLSGLVFTEHPSSASADKDNNGNGEEAFRVRVIVSHAEPMSNTISIQGETKAEREIHIRAQTNGVVEKIFVDKGESVKAGDRLVQLDTQHRQLQVKHSKASVTDAELQLEATQKLIKKGLVGPSDLARSQADLAAARASLLRAELELSYLTVKAPFAGLINDRMVEIGDLINGGDPIIHLIDLHPIKVVGQVSERFVGRIKPDQLGQITLNDEESIQGSITHVGKSALNPTRTFPVEMQIENNEQNIIAGVTAKMAIPIDQILAHNLPTSTLTLSNQGEIGVKIVNEENLVKFFPIQYISESEQGIWVSGLPGKAQVISLGQEFVIEGQSVIPVERDNPEATPENDSSDRVATQGTAS